MFTLVELISNTLISEYVTYKNAKNVADAMLANTTYPMSLEIRDRHGNLVDFMDNAEHYYC